jgi:hypothetical protein
MKRGLFLACLLFVGSVSAQTYPAPTFSHLTLNSPLTGGNGGTGVNNGSSTLTLAGNLATSGAFPITLTATGSTSLTLPTSGALLTSSAAASTYATLGANSNISSLSGLTTPLSVAQGGTGSTASTGSGSVVLATSPSITNLIATGTLSLPTNSITSSELAQVAANTVECNPTSSTANRQACTGFQLADPGPNWATLATIYDSSRTSVNNFPITSEFGSNTIGNVQALVGAVASPAGSTVAGNAAGVAGYATGANTVTAPVGVYGQGTFSSGGIQAWGGNFLASNCPTQGCGATQGNTGNVYGAEVDVNINTNSSGGIPGGNAIGLYVNDVLDANMAAMDAIRIDHAGTYPWTYGIITNTGCCAVGMQLNPVATGNTQPSQAIQLNATNSSGTTETGSLVVDNQGNLQITPGSGSILSLNSGSGHSFVKVGPSTVAIPGFAKVFANNTSGQSISSGSFTTITGWTDTVDANSNFTASTGTFTAPTNGDYLVSGQIVMSGTGISNGIVQAAILVNGSIWAIANTAVSSTAVTDNTVQFSAYVNMTGSQTLQVQIKQNSGSSQSLSTNANVNYLSVVEIP